MSFLTWKAIRAFLGGAIFGGPKLPIPIGMLTMIAAGVYFSWNVSLAVHAREEVRKAVVEFVAESELAALKATIEAEKLRAADAELTTKATLRLLNVAKESLADFRSRAAANDARVQERDDEIQELLAQRDRAAAESGKPACGCLPPAGLTRRLRDR